MAKIKFGALMVDARGKAGGTVFSKNRSGNYLKNKVTPVNPNSALQQQVRAKLAVFAQEWRGLPQDVRNGFIGASQNFPLKNIYGDTYYLAGNMLYNQLNMNLLKINVGALTSAPSPVGTQDVTIVDPSTFTTTALEIDLNQALDSDNRIIMRATPMLSAGILNYKTKLRDLLVLDTADGVNVDFTGEYTARFGAPQAGSRIGVSIQVVNKRTGETGVPSFYSSVVHV